MISQENYSETYQLLQALVQNKCVNPPGNELKSISTIKNYLFSKNIDSKVFKVNDDRACLVSTIKGTDPNHDRLILGPSHVDVVPVSNPENWSVDPFKGEIKNGFMYGRGVVDMLHIVATQTVAFSKVIEEKSNLKGDLVLWIVGDEEAGGKYGTDWFLQNHLPELGLQNNVTTYALTEGWTQLFQNKFLAYRAGQKGVYPKKIIFKGKPGHGSQPYNTENALVTASKAVIALKEFYEKKMPYTLEYSKPVIDMFSDKFPEFSEITEENFIEKMEELREKHPIYVKSIHANSTMTISPNVLHAGNSFNIITGKAELSLDIRLLPGLDDEHSVKQLKEALKDIEGEYEFEEAINLKKVPGFYSPSDSKFFESFKRLILNKFPDVEFIPTLGVGATDARYCALYGIQCYGLGMINPDIDERDFGPAHGIDEKVDLKTIDINLDYFYNQIIDFLSN